MTNKPEPESEWPAWVGAVLILALLAVLLYGKVYARDLGQWENSDPAVRHWYQSLMRPDYPTSPCCGEADAYWCDDIHVRDGKTYCTVTDDRDDGPLKRPHIPVGTEFQIPPEKLKYSDGNPTGHAILFVGAGSGLIFCFVQNGGV